MVSKIKEKLQEALVRRQYKRYERQIAQQDISYDSWIRQRERDEGQPEMGGQEIQRQSKLRVAVVCYESCRADFSLEDQAAKCDILVFHASGGSVGARELQIVADYFAGHPQTVIAYADEDEIEPSGVRKNPWLKPDWSPDTLLSYFYFGGFFALRATACEKLTWPGEADWRHNLYDLALQATEITDSVGHLDRVLFHSEKIDVWGQQPCYEDLKQAAGRRRGWPQKPAGKVSIIILSKDHPGVLSTCIHSVMEASTYRDFEMIVIDNGSTPHNRARVEEMRNMLQEKYRFAYYYMPMEFNFSRLCNIGATKACGEYLLFLNDDIEITQEDWLERMMEKAVLPHVGAVGVKLIYPNTEIIQHAGITNIHLGPAHKLQFRSDANEYYFLRNRLAFNVLGVTGACLLLKRSLFEEIGGFREDLQVAFNDVELCYHLHDLGYRNVVRNDVTLTHHESLSRGADDSIEKLKRLHRELDLLYALHPGLYNRDPYYHRYLVSDVLDQEFYPGCRYDYTKRLECTSPRLLEGGLQPDWHNEVLRLGIEFAGDLEKWQTGKAGDGDWFIQGWSYALRVDNCRYRFRLLLKPVKEENEAGTGKEKVIRSAVGRDGQPGARPCPEDLAGPVYQIPCTRQYRPDIDANLNGMIHTKLAGFCVRFDRRALPEGSYFIGILWEDACSRQRLYRFSVETLEVK